MMPTWMSPKNIICQNLRYSFSGNSNWASIFWIKKEIAGQCCLAKTNSPTWIPIEWKHQLQSSMVLLYMNVSSASSFGFELPAFNKIPSKALLPKFKIIQNRVLATDNIEKSFRPCLVSFSCKYIPKIFNHKRIGCNHCFNGSIVELGLETIRWRVKDCKIRTPSAHDRAINNSWMTTEN